MSLSKKRLIRDLRGMGIESGDHLGLGISFKSLGRMEGGPAAFVDGVLEAVGASGTILLPTFTVPSYLPSDYVYDHRRTPAYTGLIPETVRRHPDARRSRHPANSVVALGRLAEQLTRDHDEAARAYLPYSLLAEAEGKMLTIGIGDRLIAIRHEAQHLAGLLERVPCGQRLKYRTDRGEVESVARRYRSGCTRKLGRLASMMRASGIIADGRVGDADALIFSAKEGLAYMADVLRGQPELNLCDEITCLWCRHLEWTMDLYDRVEDPRFFQRKRWARRAVAAVNGIRLKDIPQLVRLEVGLKRRLPRASTRSNHG